MAPSRGRLEIRRMKPEQSERLSASQIEELSKILGVKATAIKEAFRFYFPGATYALEEGLSSHEKNQALLMYSGFKVGYLTAMTVKADPGKMAQALVFLMGLREAVAP